MHPAVVIFLSVVVTQSIAAFGKERLQGIVSIRLTHLASLQSSLLTIYIPNSSISTCLRSEQLWFLYTALFHRSTLSSQRALRREIFTTKQELAATSSQDQFAKWAKLRRKVDKGLADLERTNASLSTARSTFGMLFKGVMFVITTIMPFCITSYYGKTPIFWLPPGKSSWFGPVGWFLALPRAPKGAISSTVWQMVCTRTLISVAGALANLMPGKKEEVLQEGKIEEINEEKTQAKGSSTSTASAEGGARKRTNAKASSEKQEL